MCIVVQKQSIVTEIGLQMESGMKKPIGRTFHSWMTFEGFMESVASGSQNPHHSSIIFGKEDTGKIEGNGKQAARDDKKKQKGVGSVNNILNGANCFNENKWIGHVSENPFCWHQLPGSTNGKRPKRQRAFEQD
jgi:hypothetical protein